MKALFDRISKPPPVDQGCRYLYHQSVVLESSVKPSLGCQTFNQNGDLYPTKNIFNRLIDMARELALGVKGVKQVIYSYEV